MVSYNYYKITFYLIPLLVFAYYGLIQQKNRRHPLEDFYPHKECMQDIQRIYSDLGKFAHARNDIQTAQSFLAKSNLYMLKR